MKNKSTFIHSIIRNIVIILVLIFFTYQNFGIRKIMIIPFIICGFFSIGKNTCLLMSKKKYANIFEKLFIISFITFWFCFLLFWSYLVIKDNNYLSLLFTIPFWMAGIYIIRKFLLEVKSKTIFSYINKSFNVPVILSCFLVISVLVTGTVCLFIGIKGNNKLNETTKNYVTIDGFFTNYEIYNKSKKNNTTSYKLIYTFKVDGKEYKVSTDYGSSYIPEKNSVRKVQYNPSNPNESILSGTNSKNFLIYFGAFFILVSIAFIIGALHMKGVFNKVNIDIMGLYVGITFFIIGMGIIFFESGTKSSLLDIIKSLGLWFVIPISFIIIGIYQIIRCLFFNHQISNKRIPIK